MYCFLFFFLQIAYSVIDNRPSKKMAEFCTNKNVKLLCYGTLMVSMYGIIYRVYRGLNMYCLVCDRMTDDVFTRQDIDICLICICN